MQNAAYFTLVAAASASGGRDALPALAAQDEHLAKKLRSAPRTNEERKSRHREVERRRTRRMNMLIEQLRGEIESSGRTVDANKASVLAASIDLINSLRTEIRQLKSGSASNGGAATAGIAAGDDVKVTKAMISATGAAAADAAAVAVCGTGGPAAQPQGGHLATAAAALQAQVHAQAHAQVRAQSQSQLQAQAQAQAQAARRFQQRHQVEHLMRYKQQMLPPNAAAAAQSQLQFMRAHQMQQLFASGAHARAWTSLPAANQSVAATVLRAAAQRAATVVAAHTAESATMAAAVAPAGRPATAAPAAASAVVAATDADAIAPAPTPAGAPAAAPAHAAAVGTKRPRVSL
jgi:hypothetical protein